MEYISTTLENLIQRATNPTTTITDTAAVVELCKVLEKDPQCSHVVTRVLATKIQSAHEWEALQALSLLDTCMKQCGSPFHAEVGKFRFLNEMIKLVSPKYLGGRTAVPVKQKVLQLMHAWTVNHSREPKIREAYDMLKKQGVIKDDPPGSEVEPLPTPTPRPKNSIFEDEERSRLLQKLLQSKNPDDLQAANRLIKTMVKEDERRLEVNSRRVTELESVHINTRLLGEMLDSYRPGQTSAEELELIKELHQSCERLRPNVFRLASDTQDNEAMLNEVLGASDELGKVFDKYTAIMVHGILPTPQAAPIATSLLDLSTPSEEKLPPVPTELLEGQLSNLGLDSGGNSNSSVPRKQSNLEALGDIFGSISSQKSVSLATPVQSILQPITLQKANAPTPKADPVPEVLEKPSIRRALEDLDALGENLLKQSLPTSCKLGSQFTKPVAKVPMNLLSKSPNEFGHEATQGSQNSSGASSLLLVASNGEAAPTCLDLDFLVGGALKAQPTGPPDLNGGDDSMVDLSEETLPAPTQNHATPEPRPTDSGTASPARLEVKTLSDLHISLESIKPGSAAPLTVLDERNGISVVLHFAKEGPRPDVSVIVVTTISKNSVSITNYLFQAVVPKTCKLRLQPPSGSDLPAHNPFLPPSAITQVMLVANPNKDPVSLKFMVSYTKDDETVTEMGEVAELPVCT